MGRGQIFMSDIFDSHSLKVKNGWHLKRVNANLLFFSNVIANNTCFKASSCFFKCTFHQVTIIGTLILVMTRWYVLINFLRALRWREREFALSEIYRVFCRIHQCVVCEMMMKGKKSRKKRHWLCIMMYIRCNRNTIKEKLHE